MFAHVSTNACRRRRLICTGGNTAKSTNTGLRGKSLKLLTAHRRYLPFDEVIRETGLLNAMRNSPWIVAVSTANGNCVARARQDNWQYDCKCEALNVVHFVIAYCKCRNPTYVIS